MSTIFGPVPSRRLGRSLGIDVVPAKTCTYDCVYCESGRTTHLSVRRRCFVTPDQVMADLENYFRAHPRGADVLTFSSAGEPTLYEALGELIRAVKKRFPAFPLVVLTNGSLLWHEQVRRDLGCADRVVPSMDAATPEVYAGLNRPHPSLSLEQVLNGLEAFRRDFSGELHLEILLAAGYNDEAGEYLALRRWVDRLNPDRVELNTVVRPPTEGGVRGLLEPEMRRARSFFPCDRTTIIGRFQSPHVAASDAAATQRVLEMVCRRPCTPREMAVSLSIPLHELSLELERLESMGKVVPFVHGEVLFYCSPSSLREAP